MPSVIASLPKFQFSANGAPMVGGTLTVYVAGSITPTNTWQDSAQTVLNTNPITLDARGECVLWLDSAIVYKFVLKNAQGVIQWTQDNISGSQGSVSLSGPLGSGQVGHIDGVPGAVATTVQARLRKMPDKATGFWPDASPSGVIQRLYDRVFIGGATAADGTLANVGKDWLETLRQFTTRNSQVAASSTIGQIAITGASRSSDSLDAGSMGCIGGNFWAYNNNTAQVQSAYAGYFEARRVINGAANAGTTHGIEIDIVNLGSYVEQVPHAPNNSGITEGLRIASGGEQAGATAASSAISVINNGGFFDKGLVFHNTAFNNTGAEGQAIALGIGHALVWYNNTANPVARIRSDATTAGVGIVFSNGSINFQTIAGANVMTLSTAGVLTLTGAGSIVNAGQQVIGIRSFGWGAATSGSKVALNGASATLAQTSAAVAQLIIDLTAHGLIGA